MSLWEGWVRGDSVSSWAPGGLESGDGVAVGTVMTMMGVA